MCLIRWNTFTPLFDRLGAKQLAAALDEESA
jgi:hypothetical protein